MADSDEERDNAAQEAAQVPAAAPLPNVPGMSPEMLLFFQMQQKMATKAEEAADRRHRQQRCYDKERQEAAERRQEQQRSNAKNVKQLMQGRYMTTTRHNFEQKKRR